jgi:quinol monooxygenase YgiN
MHARSMVFPAKPGSADELAGLLVQVADRLKGTPGCISWIVARNPEAPDDVWVQELWESEEAAEAALAAEDTGEGPKPADVMALVDGRPSRTDLTPVGGVGFAG